MIDHIETVSVFQNYTKNYNEALKDIDRKILHTFRVAKAAEMIAEGLGLGSDDIDLAWFLGILHDMGRFEEILGTGRDRFTDAPMAGDEIMACVYAHQCVPRKLVKSVFDNTITFCCMAFDLEMKVARTIVKEQGYLLKILQKGENEKQIEQLRITRAEIEKAWGLKL